MDLAEAKKIGAMALFGEKYPDRVRVVTMGDFSVELCGGTHLTNSGQVGLCKIVNEEPVAKGVRRVTALTGAKALEQVRHTENLLKQLTALMKTPRPEDLPRASKPCKRSCAKPRKNSRGKPANRSPAQSMNCSTMPKKSAA